MNKDKLKIIAKCLLYSSSGDLIGFSNGILKFNKKIHGILTNDNENFIEESIEKTNDTFLRFFNGGLVEGLKMKYFNYIYSYNTHINLIICKNLLNYDKIDDKIYNIKKSLIDLYENDSLKNKRFYSDIFKNQIKKLKNKNYNYLDESYDKKANSSDPATTSLILGIYYNDNKNLNDLIYLCIHMTRLTHNNGISILGSICSALFTNFAFNKLDIKRWPFELIKILESKNFIKIYLENTNDETKYLIDLKLYIYQWKKYINLYLLEKNNEIFFKINSNFADYDYPGEVLRVLWDNFTQDKTRFYPGDLGDDVMIICYHNLLNLKLINIKNNINYYYDRLIGYTCYNSGNSSNLGMISSGIFSLNYTFEIINNLISGVDNINILKEITNLIK